jgi:oligopeptide/dipeptide ABC transporter ATP-binding protein
MYAGYIVESGPIKQIFARPQHPYTIGLLGSLPRMDETGEELQFIEGAPPDLLQLPRGCTFATRCRYRIDHCLEGRPPLIAVADEHTVACVNVEAVRRERVTANSVREA